MSARSDQMDLDDQIAYKLLCFTLHRVEGYTVWRDAHGGLHHTIPAFTTDPAATARVWQWLEAHLPARWRGEERVCELQVTWDPEGQHVTCGIPPWGAYDGATWPEALCRAALALAEALERERTP